MYWTRDQYTTNSLVAVSGGLWAKNDTDFAGLIGLDVVKWTALGGTVGWFLLLRYGSAGSYT